MQIKSKNLSEGPRVLHAEKKHIADTEHMSRPYGSWTPDFLPSPYPPCPIH